MKLNKFIQEALGAPNNFQVHKQTTIGNDRLLLWGKSSKYKHQAPLMTLFIIARAFFNQMSVAQIKKARQEIYIELAEYKRSKDRLK